jgi:hypothetical protein
VERLNDIWRKYEIWILTVPEMYPIWNDAQWLSLHFMKFLCLVIQRNPRFHGTACNKITTNLKHVSFKPYLP